MDIITVLKDVPGLFFGSYAPEIHDSSTCTDCKNNCCQYQVEMPWLKLGKGEIKVGEQYEIEAQYGHSIRMVLLPGKMITVDITLQQLTDNTDYKPENNS